MIQPFHLSFVVPDKEKAKEFYLDALGCSLGRDNETWFDILFFGHQITIHQESDSMKACKIDHFGPILSKPEWIRVSDNLSINGHEFLMRPTVKDQNLPNESGKFILKDPGGNVLEFKYYSNFDATVKQNA